MTLFKFFGPIVLFLLYKIQGHRGAPGLGQMTCDQASRASFSLNNANLHSHQNLFQLTRPTIYTYTIKLQTKTATPKHQYFFQNLTFLESAHQKEAENAREGAKSRKVLKKSHPIPPHCSGRMVRMVK